MYGILGLLRTSGENVMSTTPLEIYLLRKMVNNVKFMHKLGKLAIGCCTACNRVHYIRGWCHVIGAVSWSLTDGKLL